MSIQGAMAASLRRFDPFPEFDNVRVFKGRPETGGRQFYKSSGLIVPRFEMVPGVQIIGGAGFGQREINGAWRGARADEPLIGDGGLRNAEARTNNVVRSRAFDDVAWAKLGVTVIPDAGLAPDGALTVDKIMEVAGAGTPRISQSTVTTVGVTYTWEVFAKAAERTQIRLVAEGSGLLSAYFNLLTGAVTGVGPGATAQITPLADGWWRCGITYTAAAAVSSAYVATAEAGAPVASGDSAKGVWLSQWRFGVGPNINDPPIFTEALPATRTGYSYRESGRDIQPVHYGVARARLVAPAANHLAAFPRFVSLRAASDVQRLIWFCQKSDGTQRFQTYDDVGGGASINPGVSPVVGQYQTLAWAHRAGSFAISLDGAAVQSLAAPPITAPFTRIGYMEDGVGGSASNAETDIVLTHNGEISDAALQALSARFAA